MDINLSDTKGESLNITESVVIQTTGALSINKFDTVRIVENTIRQTTWNQISTLQGGVLSSGESNQQLAQSFTASYTNLGTIQIGYNVTGTCTDNLILKLTDTLGGTPIYTTQTSLAIAAGNYVITFTVPQNTILSLGQTYYIELSRSGARDIVNTTGFLSYPSSVYSGGSLFTRSNLSWTSNPNVEGYFVLTFRDNPSVLIPPLNIDISDSIAVFENPYLSQTKYDNNYAIRGGAGGSGETQQEMAQSFIATGTKLLSFVTRNTIGGAPTDNLIAKITASIGGAALITHTVNLTGLSGTYTITWTSGVAVPLTIGNTYYIELSRSGVRDLTNYPTWSGTGAKGDVYPGGSLYEKDNNVWSAFTNIDQYFKLNYLPEYPSMNVVSDISISDSIETTEYTRLLDGDIYEVSVSDTVEMYETILKQEKYDVNYNCYGGTAASGEIQQQLAQNFIAPNSELTLLRIRFGVEGAPTDNLIVTITDSLGGTPLFTGTTSLNGLNPNYDYWGVYPISDVFLVPGNTYYIEMKRSGSRDIVNYLAWSGTSTQGDVYPGGTFNKRNSLTWSSISSIDLFFDLYFLDNPTIFFPLLAIDVSDTVNVWENNFKQELSDYSFSEIFGGTGSADENNQALSQSFKSLGNRLNEFFVQVYKTGNPIDNAVIKITDSLGGTALTTQLVDTSTLYPGYNLLNFVIPDGINLTYGNTYYIEISREGYRDTSNYLSLPTTTDVGYGNVYPDGAEWIQNDTAWVAYTPDVSFVFGLSYGDNPIVSSGQLGGISVSDLLYISDPVDLGYLLKVNIFDSVNISENRSTFTDISDITVFDRVNISESVIATRDLSLRENISISEFVSILIPSLGNINVYESVSVTENVILTQPINNLFISKYDTVYLTETVIAESFRFSPSPGNSQPKGNIITTTPMASSSALQPVGGINNTQRQSPQGNSQSIQPYDGRITRFM